MYCNANVNLANISALDKPEQNMYLILIFKDLFVWFFLLLYLLWKITLKISNYILMLFQESSAWNLVLAFQAVCDDGITRMLPLL